MITHKNTSPELRLGKVYVPGTFFLRYNWSNPTYDLSNCKRYKDLPNKKLLKFSGHRNLVFIVYRMNEIVVEIVIQDYIGYPQKVSPTNQTIPPEWKIEYYDKPIPKRLREYIDDYPEGD